jgi:hypothetical protein
VAKIVNVQAATVLKRADKTRAGNIYAAQRKTEFPTKTCVDVGNLKFFEKVVLCKL